LKTKNLDFRFWRSLFFSA